jgi:hypothetical protein
MCSEADIKSIFGFLIDNIYVAIGYHVFQQSVGIPIGTNCVPLLADLFSYSYNNQKKNIKKAVSFNHSFRYIDGIYRYILSTSNLNFHNYVHLIYMYPDEREIKDTTEYGKKNLLHI